MSPGVVITPAARDQLRSRGVQIVPAAIVGEPHSATQAGRGPVFAAWHTTFDIRLLANRHAARIAASTDGGLRHFAELLSDNSGRQSGVVFADKPNGALHRLSDLNGVRAFWAPDSVAIREGREELNANVMVVSPQRHDPAAMEQLVNEYLETCT